MLAFDRYHLVRLVLDRLLRYLPPAWALRVWQDGDRERFSGNAVGNSDRIRRNIAFYSSRGIDFCYEGDLNRGPAQLYWSAERWAFEDCGADFAVFIEDDIVISKGFFPTMKSLGRLALNEPRIGAFSAFGDAGIGWLTQWRRRHRLQPMHHRWGYGITRDYWLRFKPYYQEYLDLLAGADYRNRDNDRIHLWLQSLGNAETACTITSQDGARTAIMLKLGCFSIMTTPSYAVNIGKRGIHSHPAFYLSNRARIHGRHAFFPWPTRFADHLPEATVERLIGESRRLEYW